MMKKFVRQTLLHGSAAVTKVQHRDVPMSHVPMSHVPMLTFNMLTMVPIGR